MTKTYYPTWCQLSNIDYYLIWFSNDLDGFVTRSDHTIACFPTLDALINDATLQEITLKTIEPAHYDLNRIIRWLHRPRAATIACPLFLDVWNLLGDLAQTLNAEFDPHTAVSNKIYDKLFWGNNLPAVTPPGKQYIPIWTKREVHMIHSIFSNGLALFRASLHMA